MILHASSASNNQTVWWLFKGCRRPRPPHCFPLHELPVLTLRPPSLPHQDASIIEEVAAQQETLARGSPGTAEGLPAIPVPLGIHFRWLVVGHVVGHGSFEAALIDVLSCFPCLGDFGKRGAGGVRRGGSNEVCRAIGHFVAPKWPLTCRCSP